MASNWRPLGDRVTVLLVSIAVVVALFARDYIKRNISLPAGIIYTRNMEKTVYHATLKTMHEAGVKPEYSHGWASGVLGNTPLEEQRITDAYTAGYEDGQSGDTEAYKAWLAQ